MHFAKITDIRISQPFYGPKNRRYVGNVANFELKLEAAKCGIRKTTSFFMPVYGRSNHWLSANKMGD